MGTFSYYQRLRNKVAVQTEDYGILSLNETGSHHLPGYAKIVMMVQMMVILFFSYWVYEQYVNDYYFQAYLNGSLQGSGLLLVILGSVAIFAVLGIGFYARLRGTRKRLDTMTTTSETGQPTKTGIGITILEPHVEQHLIEMIRKTSPPETTPARTTALMPVLKKENTSTASNQ